MPSPSRHVSHLISHKPSNASPHTRSNIQTQHLGILALPVGEFLALLHNTT